MSEPMELPDLYFRWLYGLIGFPFERESPFSYTSVCSRMHIFEFQATVPHDSNRIADAIELRHSYLRENGPFTHPATVLEVLVALAQRAEYMGGDTTEEWFKIFIKNLGLYNHDDLACLKGKSSWSIDRKIRRFNERSYKADGEGGLFPLSKPNGDQRETELWYQLGAYINERTG